VTPGTGRESRAATRPVRLLYRVPERVFQE